MITPLSFSNKSLEDFHILFVLLTLVFEIVNATHVTASPCIPYPSICLFDFGTWLNATVQLNRMLNIVSHVLRLLFWTDCVWPFIPPDTL